jgi:flagellar motor switch protein FliN
MNEERQAHLSIELGRTHLTPNDARQLRDGAIVSLDASVGDPVDVYADGRLVARGEAVMLDDRVGVRLVELLLAEIRKDANSQRRMSA